MPGVPPDALNNLKRAFKGMFKRGKKNKTDSSQPTSSYSSAAPVTAPSQVPPPQSSSSQAAAPQLPPIQNTTSPFNSASNSATDTSKPLPPTHPLATGPQDQPPVAVPVNQRAQPGPPAPVTNTPAAHPAPAVAAATTDGADEGREDQLAPGRVSPAEQGSMFDGARSGAVSAVDESSQPEEPVKTDSGIEQTKAVEPVEVVKAPTMADAPPAPPAKENVPPVVTTSTTTTTNTTMMTATAEEQLAPVTNSAPAINGAPPATITESRTPVIDPASEEKVAVTMEEPPPIRNIRTAPGMSATSGPLEEFPEGGYQ